MEYWQGAIGGWIAVDLGGALVIIACIRLHRIIKKDMPETPLERQIIEAWHRVVG